MADEAGQSGATPDNGPDPADGATPSGRSDQGATPDTQLGEAGERALERERTARREAERAAHEARTRLASLEDAGKSELERATSALQRATSQGEQSTRRIAELEAQIAERDLRDLRAQVADEFSIPTKLASRLQGTDLRSLRADAKAMADDLQAGTPAGQIGVGRGGAASARRGVDMNQLIREAAGR